MFAQVGTFRRSDRTAEIMLRSVQCLMAIQLGTRRVDQSKRRRAHESLASTLSESVAPADCLQASTRKNLRGK
jgi:hypothetical protein